MSIITKRFATLSLVALSACAGNPPASDGSVASAESSRETWEGCEEIKESLATDDVVITDANYSGDVDVWSFDFKGLSTRIPQRDWEVLPDVTDDTVSLLLTSPSARMLFIADPPAEPLEDVFQKSGLRPTMEGRARTKELFGGAPTLHQLMVKGYSNTASQLTCKQSRSAEELPVAVSLVLARTSAPGELLAVHHDTRSQDELTFLRKKTGDDGTWYELEVWVPTEQYWYIVNYQSRGRAEVEAMAATGSIGPGDPAAAPLWVMALSRAVGYPNDRNTWSDLGDELRARGASPNSLRRVDELAADPDAPPPVDDTIL